MSGINAIVSNTNLYTYQAKTNNTNKSRKDNTESVNNKHLRYLSETELKKISEAEKQDNLELKDNTDNKEKTSIKEETQTQIFVNSNGERIVAIKTSLGGVSYIKIGEVSDSLLNETKTSVNIESLEKAYNIIAK